MVASSASSLAPVTLPTSFQAAPPQPAPELHRAVLHRDADAVRRLLNAGVSADLEAPTNAFVEAVPDAGLPASTLTLRFPDSGGVRHHLLSQTALQLAAELGERGLVRLLLEHGALPGRAVPARYSRLAGSTALHLAAAAGHGEVVSELMLPNVELDPVDGWGQTPLDRALAAGSASAATLLLEGGASISERALELAARGGSFALVQLILERLPGTRTAPEMDAALAESGEGVLHVAAQADALGAPRVIRLLCERGFRADRLNRFGSSPLSSAISWRRHENVEALLACGADAGFAEDGGVTPLHVAAQASRDGDLLPIVERLIAAGAPLEATDEAGRTPLHAAIELRLGADEPEPDELQELNDPTSPFVDSAVVAALLRAGASVAARDASGRLPVERLPSGTGAAASAARDLLLRSADRTP